jgi:hypothetical protein
MPRPPKIRREQSGDSSKGGYRGRNRDSELAEYNPVRKTSAYRKRAVTFERRRSVTKYSANYGQRLVGYRDSSKKRRNQILTNSLMRRSVEVS